MGRHTKLTPAVHQKIVDAIGAGNYDNVAAATAGIGISTFYRWFDEGEQAQSGRKREFWEAVCEARAKAEEKMVAVVVDAAPKNYQAATWWLERKFYDRWGRKERQEHVGAGGGPIELTMAELVKKAAEEDAGG